MPDLARTAYLGLSQEPHLRVVNWAGRDLSRKERVCHPRLICLRENLFSSVSHDRTAVCRLLVPNLWASVSRHVHNTLCVQLVKSTPCWDHSWRSRERRSSAPVRPVEIESHVLSEPYGIRIYNYSYSSDPATHDRKLQYIGLNLTPELCLGSNAHASRLRTHTLTE